MHGWKKKLQHVVQRWVGASEEEPTASIVSTFILRIVHAYYAEICFVLLCTWKCFFLCLDLFLLYLGVFAASLLIVPTDAHKIVVSGGSRVAER